jgi:hypothetical protein
VELCFITDGWNDDHYEGEMTYEAVMRAPRFFCKRNMNPFINTAEGNAIPFVIEIPETNN